MGVRGNRWRTSPTRMGWAPSTRDKRPAGIAALVCAVSAVLIATACVSSGAATPTLSARPAASSSPVTSIALPSAVSPPPDGSDLLVVPLGTDVDLDVGQWAAISGSPVTFGLLASSGPDAGCNDCPNQVRLQASCPPDSEVLDFAFSGGMEESALERARQKDACGVTFYVVEVHDGLATVRVDRPS